MKQHSLSARRCVLICMDDDCKKHGAKKVRSALNKALKARGLKHDVDLYRVDCQNKCDDGPCLVLYPCGASFTKVKEEDVDKIADLLEGCSDD